MKSMLLCILELNILAIPLILKNIHIENAIICPQNFHRIFQVRRYLFVQG